MCNCRFCASVYRQRFPEDLVAKKVTSVSQATAFVQPGHIITFMPPVRVVNLLPIDMTYYFNNTDITGIIKPGETANILMVSPLIVSSIVLIVPITIFFHSLIVMQCLILKLCAQVDLSQTLELGILVENFPTCKELVIPPGTQDYQVRLQLYDTKDRLQELKVHIKAGIGGSLKVFFFCTCHHNCFTSVLVDLKV